MLSMSLVKSTFLFNCSRTGATLNIQVKCNVNTDRTHKALYHTHPHTQKRKKMIELFEYGGRCTIIIIIFW